MPPFRADCGPDGLPPPPPAAPAPPSSPAAVVPKKDRNMSNFVRAHTTHHSASPHFPPYIGRGSVRAWVCVLNATVLSAVFAASFAELRVCLRPRCRCDRGRSRQPEEKVCERYAYVGQGKKHRCVSFHEAMFSSRQQTCRTACCYPAIQLHLYNKTLDLSLSLLSAAAGR